MRNKLLNKCLYCGAPAKRRFCGNSHRSMYYQTRVIDKVMVEGPEEFIRKELDKPAPINDCPFG